VGRRTKRILVGSLIVDREQRRGTMAASRRRMVYPLRSAHWRISARDRNSRAIRTWFLTPFAADRVNTAAKKIATTPRPRVILVLRLPDHPVARAIRVNRRLDVDRCGRAAADGENPQKTKTREPQFPLACHDRPATEHIPNAPSWRVETKAVQPEMPITAIPVRVGLSEAGKEPTRCSG
jgi:hypothetical protein